MSKFKKKILGYLINEISYTEKNLKIEKLKYTFYENEKYLDDYSKILLIKLAKDNYQELMFESMKTIFYCCHNKIILDKYLDNLRNLEYYNNYIIIKIYALFYNFRKDKYLSYLKTVIIQMVNEYIKKNYD